MDRQLFLRSFLILLILIPTLVYALMPVKDHLRFDRKRTIAVAAPVLAVLITASALLASVSGIQFKWIVFISLAPLLGLHMWLTEGNPSMRVFSFFNAVMITGFSMVYGLVLAAPYERDGSYMSLSPLTSLLCLGVMLVLGAVHGRTLSAEMPYLLSSESLDFDYRAGLPITILIGVLLFWVTPKYATVIMTGRVRRTILAFLLLGPGAFTLIYHAMWRVAVNLTENARLRESNDLMLMEQKRYEELRAYMDETSNLRHDFRQHLLVIDGYARSRETDKLSGYISQFTESLNEHRSVFAANPAVDAVAAHYDSMASSHGVHIKWLVELPAVLPLKESDFIAIFGNLLENAVLAAAELPERERNVYVNARMLSDAMLGLTVKNNYAGRIEFNKKGLPVSSRGAGHGIGLSSVRAAVDRWNGTLEINTDDGVFTAGVLLCIPS